MSVLGQYSRMSGPGQRLRMSASRQCLRMSGLGQRRRMSGAGQCLTKSEWSQAMSVAWGCACMLHDASHMQRTTCQTCTASARRCKTHMAHRDIHTHAHTNG
eukprot:366040-Chlamydomonas_euryale.AAC.4